MLVAKELAVVLIQDLIFAALLWILEQTLEEDVMCRIGQNHLRIMIDTIECSRTSALMLIAGSLMITRALTSVWMGIMR